MASWTELDEELRRWAGSGRRATLWWRDDDAGSATPALARLLALSRDHGAPLCLAVIPQQADETLMEAIDGHACAVLQHGLAHENRAPEGEKKSEFGPHRPEYEMLADVAIGFEGLRGRFGGRHLPVFVPPWNRIAATLLPLLPLARIAALSTYRPRDSGEPAPGLRQVNCHADPIAWHDGRRFLGEEAAVGQIVEHLSRRRQGLCDADEPTGILTHHRIHDEGMWAFLEQLFRQTGQSDSAHWLTGQQVFRLPE